MHVGAFSARRAARCLFTGRCCSGRPGGALLAQKRYKLCAVVPSSAVSNWLGLKDRAVDNDEIYETAIN